MKKIKRVLSGFIATATLMTGTAFSVSAAYDNCDVNRDGTVNVRDLAMLQQYLAGNLNGANYNKFDVNKSLTVDQADVTCITAKINNKSYSSHYYSRDLGTTISYPSTSGFVANSSETSTGSRVYMRYSYKTNSAKSSYTLNPATSTSTSSVNTYSIIGQDDRYVAKGAENSGIVKLSSGGTGFVVGDHVIATAAHCVYDMYNLKWVEDLSILTYNNSGNLISGFELTPVEAHIPDKFYENWIYDTGTHPEYDYALITVEEDLSDRVHFSLGTSYNVDSSLSSNAPVYVTGCPGEVGGVSNSGDKLYSAEGNIIGYNVNTDKLPFDYEDSLLTYDVDISGGDSGAPLYTITQNVINGSVSYTYTALAINAYGGGTHNFGPVVSKYLLQFYNEDVNPNIIY